MILFPTNVNETPLILYTLLTSIIYKNWRRPELHETNIRHKAESPIDKSPSCAFWRPI